MIGAGAPRTCPKCASDRVHPSRLRSLLERVRRASTEKEPHRCHACGFRGWYAIEVPILTGPDAGPEHLRTGAVLPPITADDLDRLDKN